LVTIAASECMYSYIQTISNTAWLQLQQVNVCTVIYTHYVTQIGYNCSKWM